MDAAMPCTVSKTTGILPLKAPTNPEVLSNHHHQNRCKTEYACTSVRGLRIDKNAHSQRLKTKMMSITLPKMV